MNFVVLDKEPRLLKALKLFDTIEISVVKTVPALPAVSNIYNGNEFQLLTTRFHILIGM